MSNKRDNKKNTSKKVAENKIISMLKRDNNVEIPAMTIFMKDSKYFNVCDIDINKIRVSNTRLIMKKDNLYKYYIFYEDGGKYIPLNTCFSKALAGYYNDKWFDDGNVSKTIGFVISDDLVDRVNDIFNHIEEKLSIALENLIYKGEINHYLRTKIYKITCFIKKGYEDDHIVPNKNTKHECKPLLQIQSMYYAKEDKRVIFYYPQTRLEQCGYKDFIEYNIAYKNFMFADTEPESEEEVNDDNDERDE